MVSLYQLERSKHSSNPHNNMYWDKLASLPTEFKQLQSLQYDHGQISRPRRVLIISIDAVKLKGGHICFASAVLSLAVHP